MLVKTLVAFHSLQQQVMLVNGGKHDAVAKAKEIRVGIKQDDEEADSSHDDKRCCSILCPFDCSVSEESWTVTVDPEKLRVLFLVEFWSFMTLGFILTVAFSSHNHFNYYKNPIRDMFGNTNPCVFFDDPPFTYFGAALWLILLSTMWLYLFVDLKRVYSHKQAKQRVGEPTYGTCFYCVYTGVSIFIALSFAYFVEVFAIQPEQDMEVHWTPFSFLMWSLFFISLQHFTYMMKTGRGLKPSMKWPGGAYVAIVFTTVFIKFALDLTNVTGVKLWTKAGLHWTKTLSVVNDQVFMFWVMFFPIVIYSCFVELDQLDKVKFTIETTSADAKKN